MPSIDAADDRLVGEIAGDGEHRLAYGRARRKRLRLRFVEAGHVADRAGFDQRRDHGGAERAGAAGDDDMTVAESPCRLSSPIIADLRGEQGRAKIDYPAAEGESVADFDLAIIGGGINGAGIARDAAGRGFRVVLIEQNDLASGTSSASSKLIHGGLRYLEHTAVPAWCARRLREREVLLRAAPHLIRPLRFVLPVNAARRSAMLLRLGLLIYDWIGWRKILPGTRELDLVDRRGRRSR